MDGQPHMGGIDAPISYETARRFALPLTAAILLSFN